MRATIHRGANEIGGSCIELEGDGHRLVLDLGWPITAPRDAPVARPSVAGFDAHDPSLVGVLITHPHVDHYGLAPGIHASVPIFMGEAAYRILAEASFFTRAALPPAPTRHLRHRETFTVGPFAITPFINDHSAFDAYSVLVEASGRRLFYSGDFRGHGRKRGVFEALLRSPPPNIDMLLMEGTNIREGDERRTPGLTEDDVEHRVAALASATEGSVLAMYSPQNIDRLVTMFRAARRTGRELVLDLYAATVAAATGCASIPQAWWDGVRVYVPGAQRSRVIAERAFERVASLAPKRIYAEELRARAKELVVSCRGSMLPELARVGVLRGARAVWSLWSGYLANGDGKKAAALLEQAGVPLEVIHSSGHATIVDLQRMMTALAPSRLVPIHSFAGDRYRELFPRVERRGDGERFVI